VENFITEIHC